MADRVLTDYEKFVNTEALLACQRPIDGLVNTHELFFQVTHQVMELWMKVIAHELRVVMDEMAHDDHHQHRPREVRLDYLRAALPGLDDHPDRRVHERARQLLADGDRRQRGRSRPGICRLDLHGHHDGLRRDHPCLRGQALAARAHRPRSSLRAD